MLKPSLIGLILVLGQAGTAVAHPLQPRPAAPVVRTALIERHVLDATLASGVRVSHVVYRRERLGGRWLLQLRRQSGMMIAARDGSPQQTLRQDEFAELASRLLSDIGQQHDGRLDSIQIDATLVEPVWSGWLRHARQSRIASGTGGASALQREMRDYLVSHHAVKALCARVAVLDRSCASPAVSLDPPTFRPEYRLRAQRTVMAMPDAGFDTEGLWFSIDLIARTP